MEHILSEKENCWQLASVDRAAFIIDAEDYFRAFRESVSLARHSIFVLGWDIHSALRLVRDGSDDGLPETLSALLDALAKKNPNLQIYILSWDFAMIYAMEREFFPHYRLQWKSHDRVRFSLDGEHPVGASQHQKLVVIDDRIAFAGGMDLSKWRWDTSAHLADDERRIDPEGKPYPPFHDVQMVVDGEAAAALGRLARERWLDANGAEPEAGPVESEHDPWPPSIEPDILEARVGIARTLPEYEGRREVREVERLYLDAIEAARHFIYIENQYLSSHAFGEAIAKRLQEPGGPEVIIVGPEQTGGWLEQHTMDVLRARLLRELRRADHHDRLRVYSVRVSKEPQISLMIHAKVMVIDDRFARVGSSNLSNRSMGLDSECDLAIESTDDRDCTEAIRGFRQRLLAEHLGVDESAVRDAEATKPSLIRAIESLRGNERTLEPLSAELPEEVDAWVPDSELLDPERPVEPEELMEYFVGSDEQKTSKTNLLKAGLLATAVLVFALAWRWTPLGEWLDVDTLAAGGEWLKDRPFTPLLVLAAYVVAGFAIVPVTLLFVATVMVFGPWAGMAYALAGGELSALACFAAGHLLGRDAVTRLAGSRVNRISRKLAERGILTMVTLRIVPVAPFSVINVVAGVSDIRMRDFAIGNLIGMLPGVIAVAFVTDWVLASLREPSTTTITVALAVVAAAIIAVAAARHWLRRRGHGS